MRLKASKLCRAGMRPLDSVGAQVVSEGDLGGLRMSGREVRRWVMCGVSKGQVEVAFWKPLMVQAGSGLISVEPLSRT